MVSEFNNQGNHQLVNIPIELLNRQKDLIKEAIRSTDNYLFVLKQARESRIVTQPLLYDFSYHISRAYDCLSLLGVVEQHEKYMGKAIDEVMSYFKIPIEAKESLTFKDFILESEDSFSDEDVESIVNDIGWEDIYDLYDEDELIYDPDEQEDIEEKISPQQRIKKSQSMKRRGSQLSIARNLKLRRTSSINVLKKRAVNAARRAVYKKLLMGRNKAQLSASEKDMIEKRMKNFKYM